LPGVADIHSQQGKFFMTAQIISTSIAAPGHISRDVPTARLESGSGTISPLDEIHYPDLPTQESP
jgi:hypothetical protein